MDSLCLCILLKYLIHLVFCFKMLNNIGSVLSSFNAFCIYIAFLSAVPCYHREFNFICYNVCFILSFHCQFSLQTFGIKTKNFTSLHFSKFHTRFGRTCHLSNSVYYCDKCTHEISRKIYVINWDKRLIEDKCVE